MTIFCNVLLSSADPHPALSRKRERVSPVEPSQFLAVFPPLADPARSTVSGDIMKALTRRPGGRVRESSISS